jgi:hypothetical protein
MDKLKKYWSNGGGNSIRIFLAVAAACWTVLWGSVKIGWIAGEKTTSIATRLATVEKATIDLQSANTCIASDLAERNTIVDKKLEIMNINLIRLCQKAGVGYER